MLIYAALNRFWLLTIAALLLSTTAVGADEPVLSRIAFGACAKQDKPQPIWDAVVESQPEAFLFLGDNIYGDTDDMAILKAKWQLLGAQPGYQKLKATCPIFATWDDHDYGRNDAGADYPMRAESQQIFLDFFDVPADDVRRKQEGVYFSKIFGPAGKRTQIILLDARYHRSPLKRSTKTAEPGEGYRGIYGENTDDGATMLGETQWKWLEEQLRKPAEVRIIGSGVQVITYENGWETWGNFPKERERLFKLIRDTRASGVVLLSGDRHLSEISKLDANDPLGVGYPLFDITSTSLNAPSGNMTKSGVRFANELNRFRVGLTYFDINFGSVHIDWTEANPTLRLQIREAAGQVVLQQRLKLSDLKANP